MEIAVTGGTGFVGRHLVDRLAREGHGVRVLARDPRRVEGMWAADGDELGVQVFLGQAVFTGPDTVEVDGTTLRFKKAVIATGARAWSPPVEGLAEAGFLTNETVFSLVERPRRLGVIGGGPIGCELAQAFQRLGSEVTLLEMGSHLLAREDADAANAQRVA